LSDSNEQELVVKTPQEREEPEVVSEESEVILEPEIDVGLTKALDTYRKLIEADELTDVQQSALEKRIKEIENREIIESDEHHEPKDMDSDKIMIGPPVLTRFEKARIMGARALQLSLGAPPFIAIPETARTSLDIAMEELEQRVIPIVIRRVLPNGDYQNIPIDYFK
jgi:DNA-directed RNA polymerases I, II, and III subunit RPABC2